MFLLQLLNPARHVEQPDRGECQPAILAPGEEPSACAHIGPPRVRVADICGEEFDVAPGGWLAASAISPGTRCAARALTSADFLSRAGRVCRSGVAVLSLIEQRLPPPCRPSAKLRRASRAQHSGATPARDLPRRTRSADTGPRAGARRSGFGLRRSCRHGCPARQGLRETPLPCPPSRQGVAQTRPPHARARFRRRPPV